MATVYNAVPSAITEHQTVSVVNPADGDALSAASNNGAIQDLANVAGYLMANALLATRATDDPITGKIGVSSGGEINVNSGGIVNVKSGGVQNVASGGVQDVKSGGVLRLSGQMQSTANENQVTFDSNHLFASALGFSTPANKDYTFDSAKVYRKLISPHKMNVLAGTPGYNIHATQGPFVTASASFICEYMLDLPLGAIINSIYFGARDATTPASTVNCKLYRTEMATTFPSNPTYTEEQLGASSAFTSGAVSASFTWQQITFKASANQFVPLVGNWIVRLESSSPTLDHLGVFVDYSVRACIPST